MAAAATSTAMKLPFGTPKGVDDGIWIVSFMHNDLGFIDVEQKALQPSGTGLSPISQVRSVTYVSGPDNPTTSRARRSAAGAMT